MTVRQICSEIVIEMVMGMQYKKIAENYFVNTSDTSSAASDELKRETEAPAVGVIFSKYEPIFIFQYDH